MATAVAETMCKNVHPSWAEEHLPYKKGTGLHIHTTATA